MPSGARAQRPIWGHRLPAIFKSASELKEGMKRASEKPKSITTILKLSFSLLSIYLIAVNLSQFSRILTKLMIILVFLWSVDPLVLSITPISWTFSLICFLNYRNSTQISSLYAFCRQSVKTAASASSPGGQKDTFNETLNMSSASQISHFKFFPVYQELTF